MAALFAPDGGPGLRAAAWPVHGGAAGTGYLVRAADRSRATAAGRAPSRIPDDAARGADPEFVELIGLALGPGDELVQVPGVGSVSASAWAPQSTLAVALPLDAQLEQLQFF